MKNLIFAAAFLLMVPSLRAQQAESKDASPEAEPAVTEIPNASDSLPASIRPGHPLDPADVDILTGKRDREIEASRTAGVPISAGIYGSYGDVYAMQGRFGGAFGVSVLPLTRISNPFFFSLLSPGRFGHGFGRGGFRGRR
jgi:hypothetical protein